MSPPNKAVGTYQLCFSKQHCKRKSEIVSNMGKGEEIIRRPTVGFTDEEHKRLKVYCVMNDISLQEFIRKAALYCLDEKIEIE